MLEEVRGVRGESAMTGIERIAAERKRQIEVEGFTEQYDDQYKSGEMAMAATCYILPENARKIGVGLLTLQRTLWPWHKNWWKPAPDNRIRELEKAGALIAAEIDRLLRLEEKEK